MFGAVVECDNVDQVEVEYNKSLTRKKICIIALFCLAVVGFFVEIFTNQLKSVTFSDTVDVLAAHLNGGKSDFYLAEVSVWDYNMPRAILGLFVGASLGVGGAVMQVILRNPLATPYTTGVSAGASMGAAIYIYLGIALLPSGNYNMTVAANAIAFAMLPTLAILFVSYQKHITPTTMILAGIAMMYVFSSSTTFLMLMSDSETVESAYHWGVGSIGRGTWSNLWIVVATVIPCIIILQILARQIMLINTGNKVALTLGVNVRTLRNVSLLILAIMTAVVVGITGGIGFMGLIAPHLARILVGSNMKYLLPCSAGLGAAILLFADSAAKIAIGSGIPVGVITSVIGGPIFILILIKSAKKVWY